MHEARRWRTRDARLPQQARVKHLARFVRRLFGAMRLNERGGACDSFTDLVPCPCDNLSGEEFAEVIKDYWYQAPM
jgi:hypothetical protein